MAMQTSSNLVLCENTKSFIKTNGSVGIKGLIISPSFAVKSSGKVFETFPTEIFARYCERGYCFPNFDWFSAEEKSIKFQETVISCKRLC